MELVMPALTDAALTEALTRVPGWAVEAGELSRSFHFKDFVQAFGFISQVAALQEQMDHHATITNTYGDVKLQLHTHSEGGITDKDIELASRITERAGGAREDR
jgi:4a-hydroxytetrahydrobiopterin dehydratase